MTGDDLKHVQDHFLEGAKTILRESGRLRPVGFVITLHKHVDKLFESGWGIEFIDPKTACSVVAECPFCGSTVTIYLWSIAGNGKKLCSCGAALHSDGVARKLVEISPSDLGPPRRPTGEDLP